MFHKLNSLFTLNRAACQIFSSPQRLSMTFRCFTSQLVAPLRIGMDIGDNDPNDIDIHSSTVSKIPTICETFNSTKNRWEPTVWPELPIPEEIAGFQYLRAFLPACWGEFKAKTVTPIMLAEQNHYKRRLEMSRHINSMFFAFLREAIPRFVDGIKPGDTVVIKKTILGNEIEWEMGKFIDEEMLPAFRPLPFANIPQLTLNQTSWLQLPFAQNTQRVYICGTGWGLRCEDMVDRAQPIIEWLTTALQQSSDQRILYFQPYAGSSIDREDDYRREEFVTLLKNFIPILTYQFLVGQLYKTKKKAANKKRLVPSFTIVISEFDAGDEWGVSKKVLDAVKGLFFCQEIGAGGVSVSSDSSTTLEFFAEKINNLQTINQNDSIPSSKTKKCPTFLLRLRSTFAFVPQTKLQEKLMHHSSVQFQQQKIFLKKNP